ncbi:hypothetical protein HanHA89_Chr03g0112721 [Helianthus annuus]|nr:hypothetical protein HanHA89_Chr03g0112721 [Helianthus annuus]
MSTGAKPSTKKRKYKPRHPPGPDQAEINWKEEEFHNLVQNFCFLSDWGVQFPTPNSTALDAPPGYVTLYAHFFREGNFRLLMKKFAREVLTSYGLHISQINALGFPRLTHFEFICRANRVEPTFEKFNVFYFVTYTGDFYSFNSRTSGVDPCSSHPPKSLHDWKQKFFYIRRGVIPIDMHYRAESEGVPCVNVSVDFTEQEWHKVLTRKVTAIIQLEERALVAARMSMLWAPQNPRGFPIYGYQGKGSQRGTVHEPVADNVDTPIANPLAGTAEQVETRKKKKKDKTEEKEAEEPVTETPLRRPVIGWKNYSSLLLVPEGNVVEDVAAGAGRGGAHAEGVEIEVESSEATPRQGAIYIKRVRSSGGGGASGTRQSPEFQHVQGGSWTTHNPACDDLPHAPHLTLTQGSRMNDLSNCREFYSLCLPPTERLFQKNRHQMDLLDDHIHAGVNFYATCQEIVKEWQLMGEDTLEFEATKKELAEEREKFNAEKKGLSWRVADAEDKLAKEKQFNANKQKEWETACEGTNQEMKTARDEIVRLKGEKTKMSMNRSAPYVKKEREREREREREYIQRIAKLEKIASEKAAESEASEILVEEATADCKWLLVRDVPLIADHIVKSDELAKYMFELGEAAYNNGRMDGYSEGMAAVVANEKVDHFDLYKTDCDARYASKRQEYEFLEFAIVKAVGKLSRKTDAVEVLKKALGDQDPEAGGAGSKHQV